MRPLQEELVAAHSLGFELQSGRLYCGYDRTIRAFDIQRPGLSVEKWDTFGKLMFTTCLLRSFPDSSSNQ